MERIIEEIVKEYNLAPLPEEGGYFRKVLGSPDSVASVIYYLMTEMSFSALHKINVHEIWTFISGDPIEQVIIDEDKRVHISYLGIKGEDSGVKHVASNLWQGSRLKKGGERGYALCTTTCVPPYTQEGFILATHSSITSLVKEKDLAFVSEFLAP